MDSYLCPACGATANETGCSRCGRAHDPDAQALAMLTRALASLETKKRNLNADQLALRGQIAHVSAQHDAMSRKIRDRVQAERGEIDPDRGRRRGMPRRRSDAENPRDAGFHERLGAGPALRLAKITGRIPPAPAAAALTGSRAESSPPSSEPLVEHEALPSTQATELKRPAPDLPQDTSEDPLASTPKRESGRTAARPAHTANPAAEVAETTTGSMQTVLLALGGFLLAGAAVVLALVAFASLGVAGRMALLTLVTSAALAFPVLLARKGLAATADTVATVALLLLPLDGYVAWTLGLFAADTLETNVYFGLVCLATAAIALGYHLTTRLVAPRFAALVALQPVVPLLGYDLIGGWASLALVLVAVGTLDLAFAAGWARMPNQTPVPAADRLWSRLAWVLWALAYLGGLLSSTVALATVGTLAATALAAGAAVGVAALGVAGGIVLRRPPLPDLTAGIGIISLVTALSRLGAAASPASTSLLASLAIAVAASTMPLVPRYARRGAATAGAATAAGAGILLLVTAFPAIIAPLRAVLPAWEANLARYESIVADAAGSLAWQLVVSGLLLTLAATIMLPSALRIDGVVLGSTLTMLTVPAVLGFGWTMSPLVTAATAIALTAVALNVTAAATIRTCLWCAAILAGHAAVSSLARPSSTALTLAVITVAGAAIASAPRVTRPDPDTERLATLTTDSAGCAALLALPGATAAGMALVVGDAAEHLHTPLILFGCFIALAISVGVTALAQLARGKRSTPLLVGASTATAGVLLAAILAPGATALDLVVGLLIAISVGLLWVAPLIDARHPLIEGEFRGADAATAALTIAVIGAVTRAVALVHPEAELASVAAIVLVTALGTKAFPPSWRRGPIAGGSIIGLVTGVSAGGFAVAGAVGIARAALPVWHAPLGASWQRTASSWSQLGPQIPVTLFLLALAAWVGLPSRYRNAASAPALVLALVSCPVAFGLGWAYTLALCWFGATALATAAALALTRPAGVARLAAAGVLATVTVIASLVRPDATAVTLLGFTISGALVAALASGLERGLTPGGDEDPGTSWLTRVGGGCAALAVASFPLALGALATASGRSAEISVTVTLAAAALGLAVAGLACQRAPGHLPFVSVATGVVGLAIVIGSAPTRLPTAGYAAAAALLAVLAELLRASTAAPGLGRGTPGESRRSIAFRSIAFRSVPRVGGFGPLIVLTAGLPAAIAVFNLAPAIGAALFGPYRWVTSPWQGHRPAGSGWFSGWAGGGADVLAALVLTLAAALVAVGLEGDRKLISNRAITVIVPGVAVTLLIAPAALGLSPLARSTSALAVAAVATLSVALTPPPDPDAASSLWAGRRLAVLIAGLTAGAGFAGSLDTRAQTIVTLGCSVLIGAAAAVLGKTSLSRIAGCQMAALAAESLALACGLAAGLPLALCAYPILMVSGLLLGVAAIAPRLGRPEALHRQLAAVETTAYTSAMVAVAFTIGASKHTAAVCFALAAILGIATARPGRADQQRTVLVFGSALAALVAVWLVLATARTMVAEAYTLPFATLALAVGAVNLRWRTEIGSWTAYGPGLVVGFAPTLVIVLDSDTTPVRRVTLIAVAVLTVAIGAIRRQRAPVVTGAVVTAVAVLHEVLLLGRLLPWQIMLLLFTAAGALLVGLGATYEKRQQNVRRLRGAFGRMR